MLLAIVHYIHHSTRSADGLFPTRRRVQDLPLLGFFPLGRLYLYALLMGFFPLGGVNANVSTSSFSAILRELKPLAVGFFPFGIPHYAAGIFPSQSPV